MSKLFEELIEQYSQFDVEFPGLKAITIAQWWLESSRGTSKLATDHLNFGGLKWRAELSNLARKVEYEAHDGVDDYCKFDSLENFIKGYWRFLDRSPYLGWRDHTSTAKEFISYIGPIYAPRQNYVEKVLQIEERAEQLLAKVEHQHHHAGTTEPFQKPAIKEFIPSPNFSSRAGSDIDTVFVHYTTAATALSTIRHFQNPEPPCSPGSDQICPVSAHYIIDRNGDIYQMVKDSDKAWHAGNANRSSIGIEHVARVGDRLTEVQEKASVQLIRWLMAEYKIPKENIKAHKEVGNTSCPGNIFGDRLDDLALPEFRKWVAEHFSQVEASERDDREAIGPSGLGIYIIRPGDSLTAIALRHGTTVEQLLMLNPFISDADQIFPGQKIRVAAIVGDERFVSLKSSPLKLPIEISEKQLYSGSYQVFSHPLLGNITITGGFMEPEGHSWKGELKAIFRNKKLKVLPPAPRNIGIDYVVSDRQVRAWYGGVVTRRGMEGGYGRRIHIELDLLYEHEGVEYQVYQAYAHLQKILVSEGETIQQGQDIGIMGGSSSRSDHAYPLHVDLNTYILMNGESVSLNPQALDQQLLAT